MNKKYIIIIAVIIIIAAVGGYLLMNNNMETSKQTTLILSKSAYMEVPENNNATSKADKEGIFYYIDMSDEINVTSSSNISTSDSAKEMKKIITSIEHGSKKIVEDGVVMYLKDGIYSIFINNTQYKDTVLLQSTNKNLLLNCWQTLKFHSPTDKFKIGNTTESSSSSSGNVVNAVEKTQSSVESSSSTSSSSSSSSSSGSSIYDYTYSNSYKSNSKSSNSKSSSSGGRSITDV